MARQTEFENLTLPLVCSRIGGWTITITITIAIANAITISGGSGTDSMATMVEKGN